MKVFVLRRLEDTTPCVLVIAESAEDAITKATEQGWGALIEWVVVVEHDVDDMTPTWF